jgi:hypothetical protein
MDCRIEPLFKPKITWRYGSLSAEFGTNPRDLVALGDFGCAEPVAISEEDLARIPERPPNGTVVIQDRDPTIHVIRDGLRFGLPSPEEFDAAGFSE